MRRILILGLLFFICTALACSAHAVKTVPMTGSEIYTHDGEYDPASFCDWYRLKSKICKKGHHHLMMGNPDLNGEPKLVELITVKWKDELIVVTYIYFKDGVMYVFTMNRAIRHYMQTRPIKPVENLRIK